MKNSSQSLSTLNTPWKLKYILPNGVWIPQKGKCDIIIYGKLSSQRLKYAQKLVNGFRDIFDSAYLYEVGENGSIIATFNKQSKVFILTKKQNVN